MQFYLNISLTDNIQILIFIVIFYLFKSNSTVYSYWILCCNQNTAKFMLTFTLLLTCHHSMFDDNRQKHALQFLVSYMYHLQYNQKVYVEWYWDSVSFDYLVLRGPPDHSADGFQGQFSWLICTHFSAFASCTSW